MNPHNFFAEHLLPVAKDALAGLAEIQARAGESAAAVSMLRQLLSFTAGVCVSIQRSRIDPVWDPIRKDPAFLQLLTIHEKVGP